MGRSDKFRTPDSYEQSREVFRAGLASVRAGWPDARLDSLPVPGPGNLTIDVIHADALRSPQRLFILSTGLHGIEGYAGSVMMQLFLQEFLTRLDPTTAGLVLVHAINPGGMQQHYRNNPANVDLNRNFIEDTPAIEELNPDYPALSWFLNPQRPVGPEWSTKLFFWLRTVTLIARYGPVRIREAALMGQYRDPSGMYFGGRQIQPETRHMMGLIRAWVPRYEQTLHLDMHTGYGPRYIMTLVQTPVEPMTSTEAMERFGLPRVAATDPKEFYQIHGELSAFCYQIARQASRRIYSAAFEFGTYGAGLFDGARSLLTSIISNQLHQHGAAPGCREWAERDYRELYFPGEPRWLEAAQNNARQAFENILQAEGYFAPE